MNQNKHLKLLQQKNQLKEKVKLLKLLLRMIIVFIKEK